MNAPRALHEEGAVSAPSLFLQGPFRLQSAP